MDIVRKTDGAIRVLNEKEALEENSQHHETPEAGTLASQSMIQEVKKTTVATISEGRSTNGPIKCKRKHRRGKPKSKNANKPYKKTNWKFQMPRSYSNSSCSRGGVIGANLNGRIKLARSRSLVPYNTNKFLMEEHLAEVPSALLTPSGRTRDSSFSVDSEDNYIYSLPEDEEEFLTKEFANVYEKARVERLEGLTKQQLIEECLQIEDRYSDQGRQQLQQRNIQTITPELLCKIRSLEEKIRDLTRENYELRCQLLLLSGNTSEQANPQPTPMDSLSSEDSESDSSSSSSSSKNSSLHSSLSANRMVYDINGQPGQMDAEPLDIQSRLVTSLTNGSHNPDTNDPSHTS